MLNLSFKQSARLGNLVMRSKRAENLIYVKTLRDAIACQTKCWKCKFNNMKRYLWNVKSWLLGEDWLELLEKRLKNNSGCALNKKNPFMVVLIIVRLPEGNKNNQYTSLSTRLKQLKNVFSNRWWIENANQINVIRVVALLHCKSISYFRYAWCILCHVDFWLQVEVHAFAVQGILNFYTKWKKTCIKMPEKRGTLKKLLRALWFFFL